MEEKYIKTAKKNIKKEPMPSSLLKEFKENGREHLLEKVYCRTAELIKENEDASKALQMHLEQILPCIAFFEVLTETEESREKALELYSSWCLLKIEKIAVYIPRIMKIPGLYKAMPKIFDKMLDALFGEKAGFASREVKGAKGFARDMVCCPYVETCKKYNCLEIAQFFCKSDDITYGNMHPRLIFERTQTLGTGGECCDFRLYVK